MVKKTRSTLSRNVDIHPYSKEDAFKTSYDRAHNFSAIKGWAQTDIPLNTCTASDFKVVKAMSSN